MPEAATGGILQEKMFLEISQNSQENTCARVSILNVASGLQLNYNIDSSTSVSLWIFQNV